MDNETTVQDLIALSYDQKPIDFEQAFGSLITDRIAQAVADKKTEIAQSMFGGSTDPDPEDEEVEDTEQPEDLDFDETEYEETPEEPQDGETAQRYS